MRTEATQPLQEYSGATKELNCMIMKLVITFIALTIPLQNVIAKGWRGIIPLKSTRAEVERQYGKPDKYGRYQLKKERATVLYSDGSCERLPEALKRKSCKCLVDRNVVLAIYVNPLNKRRFSRLKINKRSYVKTSVISGPGRFTYSNLQEGVVYTVDKDDGSLTGIDYFPSQEACEMLVKAKGDPTLKIPGRF